jgi:nicotinic acetylcholine receptor
MKGPILCYLVIFGLSWASEDEYRLLQDLKKDYDPMERPVADHRKALDVKLRIYLQQILEIVRFIR